MTTKEILELDCRNEHEKRIIEKALKKIKPLAKYEDEIPMDKIEKAIKIMSEKYGMMVRCIYMDNRSNKECPVYGAFVVNESDLKDIASVFGTTVFELFAKTAIAMYAESRKRR